MAGATLGTLLAPVLTPISLLVALVVDVVTRAPRMRRTRVVAMISGLVIIDFAGMVRLTWMWLISPFGLRPNRPAARARYRRGMRWWTNQVIRVISLTAALPIDRTELDDKLLAGNAIVVGRHRSLLDAVLPAVIFGNQGHEVLYVLKDDLQQDINIDVIGGWMGHVFVNRSPKNLEEELEPIRALGSRIDESSVGVIFPEGTFFNQKRKERAVSSLRRRNEAHAEIAEQLEYLLPPRPAGTLALLEGAPDADVIILGHVGFEPFGTIGEILRNLGAGHDVALRAWRFARAQVPTDPQEQIDWLFERWVEMDRWIASRHPLNGLPSTIGPPDH